MKWFSLMALATLSLTCGCAGNEAPVANETEYSGPIREFSCPQDPAPNSAEKVQQRLNWAWKCHKDGMDRFGFGTHSTDNFWSFKEGRVMIYPVLGFVRHGSSVILQAPIDKNVSCDALSQIAPNQKVKIIGFCGIAQEE